MNSIDLCQFKLGEVSYLDTRKEEVYGALSLPWSAPKILANAGRKSRKYWCFAAVVDRLGLVASQQFIGLWPKEEQVDLDALTALLNGPVITCAISSLLYPSHPHHAAAKSVVASLPDKALQFVSVVTIGEMEFGLRMAERANSKYLAQFRSRIDTIRAYPILDLTRHTAAAYAELKHLRALAIRGRANLQKPSRWLEDWIDANTGKQLQIDENDLWVAAQAKERDFALVSGDKDMLGLSEADTSLHVILAR